MADAAPADVVGGRAAAVGPGVVSDRAGRARIRLDVVATGEGRRHGRVPVLAVGESKWGQTVGPGDVARLRRARDLLGQRDDLDVARCRLLLFAGGRVDRVVRAAHRRGEVHVVGLDDLHAGD